MPYLDLDGRQIFFRQEGSGPPIVLLHCSSSHSGQWKPWVAQLEDHAHLLAPDFHGYGRSENLPDDTIWWEVDRAIVPALARYAGGRVHVVGHSLGGAAAVHAALSYPDHIVSLTLIEPVLFGLLEEADVAEQNDAKFISTRVWGLLSDDQHESAAREFTDFWSGPGAFDRLAPHQREYIERTIERVGADWRGIENGLPGQIRFSDLASLPHPVHLVYGMKSRPSAQRIVQLLDERLPRSDLTVIPEADHMGAVMQPSLFIPAIMEWLSPRLAI